MRTHLDVAFLVVLCVIVIINLHCLFLTEVKVV